MTHADLRSLAEDHAHLRHHPHEVAAALLQAAEWIEHGQRRVADLVNVANAFAAETAEAAADAARYRWLRDNAADVWAICKWDDEFDAYVKDERRGDIVDAAVDAAMQEAT